MFRGILFVLARAFLRIYKFSPRTSDPAAVLRIVAYAFSFLGLIALGSVGTGLANALLYTSSSLRYATRHTKLTPRRAAAEIVLAGTLSLILYLLVLLVSIYALSYARFRVAPRPYSIPLVILAILAMGAIMFEISFAFSYAAAISPVFSKSTNFLVLLLSFLAYFALRIDYGAASYAMPLLDVAYVSIYAFTGEEPARGNVVYPEQTPANIFYASMATIARISILALIAYIELRLARGIAPIEVF